MKVYNLGCERDHRFEGWFGSADDYQAQLERGLLECPLCASREVRRLPSAPRLNLSGASRADRAGPSAPAATPVRQDGPASTTPPAAADAQRRLQALQAAWLAMARQVVASTQDVGARFAEEARRIHYREVEARAIRGTATPDEAAELADEGIEVYALPLPAALKEPLQ